MNNTVAALTANGILELLVSGFFWGIGFGLAFSLVGIPFRRWYV